MQNMFVAIVAVIEFGVHSVFENRGLEGRISALDRFDSSLFLEELYETECGS
jgi:hypothetical protein